MSAEDEMVERLRQLLEKAAEEQAMRGPDGERGQDGPSFDDLAGLYEFPGVEKFMEQVPSFETLMEQLRAHR